MARRLSTMAMVALAACSGPEAAREASQRSELQVCAGPSTVPGIDVSYYQGTIDWAQVAGAGYAFAITRINDGTFMDPQFGANWAGIKSHGMIRGAYQFWEPTDDATYQANVAINAVGVLGPGDLPLTLDVEWTTGTPNAADIQTWVNLVTAGTGKKPMIYTAVGYWDSYFHGEFGDLTLWVANYGVSCPHVPDSWSGWTFWQPNGAGVPGISGNVDQDLFNGTLADLQQFAGSNQAPRGYLDGADCTHVWGWSQDPDVPAQSIDTHVYFGGPAGSGAVGKPLHADGDRADLCAALGSCNHAYDLRSPRSLFDGAPHEVHAYGIDSQGGANPELAQSPGTLTCMPSELGVKRHITDPASYAAWGFDAFMDVRPVNDADLGAWPEAAPWPAAPLMVQAPGEAAVWLVDGAFRRHVTSPTSAADWHLDLANVQQRSHADVYALVEGPPLRERPPGVQGSGPAVYVLDDALPDLTPDAGPPPDAGHVAPDAGHAPPDAGHATDAGPAADAGHAVDAGPASDAGAKADAGSAADAGAHADAGPTALAPGHGGVTGGCQSSDGVSLLALGLAAWLRRRR